MCSSKVAIAALLCASLHAAVAVDAFKDANYQGAGIHSTTIVASGTNLGCLVWTWYRSGSTNTPTCGGNAMTLVSSVTTSVCVSAATVDTWVYFGAGLSAGTLTVSVSATVESLLEVMTVNGARQSSQPDSVATQASGTSDGLGQAFMPATTLADKSLVVGDYCSPATLLTTPSTNGTLVGHDAAGVGLYFWSSTSTITPAGSFSLVAKGSAGTSYQVNGLSIAPFVAGGNSPRLTLLGVGF